MMFPPILPPFVPQNTVPLSDPGITINPVLGLEPLPGPNVMTSPPMMMDEPYQAGEFCFGLDRYICESVPKPFQGTCRALANFFCGVVVGVFLIVVLAVALNAILPPRPQVVPVPV